MIMNNENNKLSRDEKRNERKLQKSAKLFTTGIPETWSLWDWLEKFLAWSAVTPIKIITTP